MQDPNSFSLWEKMIVPMAAALLLAYIYHKGIRKYKKATIALAVITIALSSTTAYIQYDEYNSIVELIEEGKTKTIEGKVEHFKPIDLNNHDSLESFEIKGVKFSYSDYHRISGYHHSCELGGVICKDSEVMITYYSNGSINYIVRIENL